MAFFEDTESATLAALKAAARSLNGAVNKAFHPDNTTHVIAQGKVASNAASTSSLLLCGRKARP